MRVCGRVLVSLGARNLGCDSPEIHLECPAIWRLLVEIEVAFRDALGRESLHVVVKPPSFLLVAKECEGTLGTDRSVDDLRRKSVTEHEMWD